MQCNYDTSEALQRLQVEGCPQSGKVITLLHVSVALTAVYEGRSINKLQNGIILLIFKI